MSDPDDEPRTTRDGGSLRARLVRSLGGLDSDSSDFVLIFLALFAPGLGIVGYGAAEGLAASTWAGIGGALLGVCASVAVFRDFLRWRFSWLGALLGVAFCALLVAAYR